MVRNVNGNCGFASIEIIARHQGFTSMYGFSQGKGGSTPFIMAHWLDRYGVEYTQVSNRTEGFKLMRQFLAQDKPVLFSIPRHALVCCGLTTTASGQELVWVVDNSGPEAAKIKGWTKQEWDSRFDGWVCGLVRCSQQSKPQQLVRPGQRPPHVDPAPGLIPDGTMPKAPPTITATPIAPPAILATPVATKPCIDLLGLKRLKADLEEDKARQQAAFDRIDKGFAEIEKEKTTLVQVLTLMKAEVSALQKSVQEAKSVADAASARLTARTVEDAGKLIEVERRLMDQLLKVKGAPGIPGPQGSQGTKGESGTTGKDGLNGKDGRDFDPVALQKLIDDVERLRNVTFEAELLDETGTIRQRVQFGPNQPLRLKLVPVK